MVRVVRRQLPVINYPDAYFEDGRLVSCLSNLITAMLVLMKDLYLMLPTLNSVNFLLPTVFRSLS